MPRTVKENGEPLGTVEYKVKELLSTQTTEESFVRELYEHTESDNFPEDQFFEALKQYKEQIPYRQEEDHGKINKIRSWIDCFNFLREMIKKNRDKWEDDLSICFEYKLSSGNFEDKISNSYVDVLFVMEHKIILLEFKSGTSATKEILLEHRQQIIGYYNRICYHNKNVWEKGDSIKVKRFLVYTSMQMSDQIEKRNWILDATKAGKVLTDELDMAASDKVVDELLTFDEEIAPTMTGTVLKLLKTNVIDEVYDNEKCTKKCSEIMNTVLGSEKSLKIILVRGAPGTGKTGTAFSLLAECIAERIVAKYVTGNRNLVNYFKSLIDGEKEAHSGIGNMIINKISDMYDATQYIKYSNNATFNDQVVLVDEAQRMWGCFRLALTTKRNNYYEYVYTNEEQEKFVIEDISEPFLLLDAAIKSIVADKDKKSRCIVFFLGGDQEIRFGEENGEESLIKAIINIQKVAAKYGINVTLYTSQESDKNRYPKAEIHHELTLEKNRRNLQSASNLALVNDIISGSLEKHRDRVLETCYTVFNANEVTINQLMDEIPCEMSGALLLPSACAKKLKDSGNYKQKSYYDTKSGDKFWENQNYSINTRAFWTEFDCQGLEFDMTVLIWSDAMKWRNGKWIIEKTYPNSNKIKSTYYPTKKYCDHANELIERVKYKVPQLKKLDFNTIMDKIIENEYRVLLTRARQETYIYVEDAETFDYLKGFLG